MSGLAKYAALLLMAALPQAALARGVARACPDSEGAPGRVVPAALSLSDRTANTGDKSLETSRKLIVVGFMGGHIKANNLAHREAQLARTLRDLYPARVHAAVFANRNGHGALEAVLRLLDRDGDGCLSVREKETARIVIYGHSWGASETVNLARRLNRLNIPVLLTVQVDSVQKSNENDGIIPPNVREAVNFYQTDGLLHGRSSIEARDPSRTKILGNFESSYREHPVSCAGFPWYARAFMRPHIEIENDPLVWNRVEALIAAKVAEPGSPVLQ
jgi:hypothetical protein